MTTRMPRMPYEVRAAVPVAGESISGNLSKVSVMSRYLGLSAVPRRDERL